MKILAIMGSPRKKGNTYRVVGQIENRLNEYDGNIAFEYLFLKDYQIDMCTGCFCCFAKGADKCPLKDDIGAILEKMEQADGIIFAAPCYAMGVPGLIKNFIDRLAYTLHRPRFFDKVFLAVTTVGGVMGTKQALEQLALLATGGRLAGKLGITVSPVPLAGVDKSGEKKIRKAAKAFYTCLAKPRRQVPGIGHFAHYHAFKAFCASVAYQKACPADHAYYADKGEYFYPLGGHPFRRLFGRFFGAVMGTVIRRMVKEPSTKQKAL